MIAAVLIASAAAVAAPAASAPCDGCTLDVPVKGDAMPLLVVLHADRETARAAADRWKTAVDAGWVVLGLQCPTSEGCSDGNWARWNGDPHWITEQVNQAARQLPIALSHGYLAGNAGGAAYIGMHAPAWADTFAALVIEGGGQPPLASGCPTSKLPAYFIGSADAPRGLRAYFERCKQEVVTVTTGATLDRGELRTLLDWLHRHLRVTLVALAG